MQSAFEAAKAFVNDDQIDDECLKILEYNKKAVVYIANLEQRIAEENGIMALKASAASSVNDLKNYGNCSREGYTRSSLTKTPARICRRVSVKLRNIITDNDKSG